MESIIYKYINKINGKMYIGQTINKDKRKRQFYNKNVLYTSQKNKKLSKIDQARQKYGVDNFEYSILEKINMDNKEDVISKLNELEKYYIDKFNSIENGYNIMPGGGNEVKTEETINKIKQGVRSNLENTIYRSSTDIKNKYLTLPLELLQTKNYREVLIYLYIQLYSQKNISKPALKTLIDISNQSINTIRKLIKLLEKDDFISVDKTSNITKYYFKEKINSITICSNILLTNILSELEKYFLISLVPYSDNNSCITMSNKELSNLINISESTISRCNKSLEIKQYLKVQNQNKIYNLKLILENNVEENTNKIKALEKDIEMLKRALIEKDEKIKSLEQKSEIIID